MALTGDKCRYCKKWITESNFFTCDVCNDCAKTKKLDGFDKIRLENLHRLKAIIELK